MHIHANHMHIASKSAHVPPPPQDVHLLSIGTIKGTAVDLRSPFSASSLD
jgi:hypothetical protein